MEQAAPSGSPGRDRRRGRSRAASPTNIRAPSRCATRSSSTSSSRCSPRATSSSRTPGRRQDDARARPRALARLGSRACSARRTCCPPTSSARNVFNQREDASSSGPGRSSPTSCSSTRSTARRRRRSRACSSACRSAASPSTPPHELARPFLVLATQNPVEFEGTYPLPEAQVDRFMVRLSLGYPTPRRGRDAARPRARRPRARARARRRRRRDRSPPRTAHRVHASEALRAYVVALLRAPARTRASSSAPARAPG